MVYFGCALLVNTYVVMDFEALKCLQMPLFPIIITLLLVCMQENGKRQMRKNGNESCINRCYMIPGKCIENESADPKYQITVWID